MAEEPENLVLAHLREIRSELRGIREKQDEHSRMFEQNAKELEKIAEAAYLGVGLATMANHKLDRMEERIEVFDRRLQAVE